MSDDLVSGLLSAIEQREKLAEAAGVDGAGSHDQSWHTVPCGYRQREWQESCECEVPQAILRLCRAHRDIIELYEGAVRVRDTHPDHAGNQGYLWALGHTLKALTVGYGLKTEEDSR